MISDLPLWGHSADRSAVCSLLSENGRFLKDLRKRTRPRGRPSAETREAPDGRGAPPSSTGTAGFWGHCGVRGGAFCEPTKKCQNLPYIQWLDSRNAPHDTSRTLGQAALTHSPHTHLAQITQAHAMIDDCCHP